MFKLSEKGAAPILLLVAILGIIVYVAISSAAPFKDKLFTQLYPKRTSQAASDSMIWSDSFEGIGLSQDWTITGTGFENILTSNEAPTFVAPVSPKDGVRVLLISSNGSGSPVATKQFSSPQQGIVSVWFYDPSPGTRNGAIVMVSDDTINQVVMLGVNPNYPDYYYRAATNNASWGMSSTIPRKVGWRKFEIVVTPKGSYGKIDGINLSFLPDKENRNATSVNPNLTSFTKITIAIPGWQAAGKYFFDDLKTQALPAIPVGTVSREKHFLQKYLGTTTNYPGWSNPIDEGRIKGIRATALAYLKRNAQDISEAKGLILDIANNYPKWIREVSKKEQDGSATPADYWTGTFVSSSMGLAAWMLWPQLDNTTKAKVKEALSAQAEKYLDLEPRSTFTVQGQAVGVDPNNTAAEENASIADTLLLASQMFPQDPRANNFEAQGKKFAFHTLTRKGLNESYGGRITEVTDENYLISEHGIYPNPNYSVVGGVGMLGSAARYYLRSGKTVPDELGHNIAQVFEAHQKYFTANYRFNFLRTGELYTIDELGGKDDWAVDGTYLNSGFAYYSYLTGKTEILSQLQEYELYVTKDILAFPSGGVDIYRPGCRTNLLLSPPVYDSRCKNDGTNWTNYYSQQGVYLINSVNAWSHLVSAMLYDSLFLLPSTALP